ncbi:MAG: alkaline phosphatase family protein, partial [Planctomycetota bacterium]
MHRVALRLLAWPSRCLIALLAVALCGQLSEAQGVADNVILITLDGLRVKEVFAGADARLADQAGSKPAANWFEEFDGETAKEKREQLLPFLWSRISKEKAWIAGDYEQGSMVRVTNGRYFSYPGYNELLSGFPDSSIDSNAKEPNPNQTVLEYLNQQPELIGSVKAFCSWDVFPFIINAERSRVTVNAGWTKLTEGNPARLAILNHTADNLFHEWESVRYDVFTASGAIEAMRSTQPRVLYVALGETDDWAHAGRYDRYLAAAKQNDHFIQQLWLESQQHRRYRRTAFIVTSDHGRGSGKEGWKNHSDKLPGSERVWIAAFGSGIE